MATSETRLLNFSRRPAGRHTKGISIYNTILTVTAPVYNIASLTKWIQAPHGVEVEGQDALGKGVQFGALLVQNEHKINPFLNKSRPLSGRIKLGTFKYPYCITICVGNEAWWVLGGHSRAGYQFGGVVGRACVHEPADSL